MKMIYPIGIFTQEVQDLGNRLRLVIMAQKNQDYQIFKNFNPKIEHGKIW